MKRLYRKYDRVLQSAVPATTGPHRALSGLRCSGEQMSALSQSLVRLMNRDGRRRQLSAAMYREEQE
jgi:hypothetical protein